MPTHREREREKERESTKSFSDAASGTSSAAKLLLTRLSTSLFLDKSYLAEVFLA
jgi:hypothetical protein